MTTLGSHSRSIHEAYAEAHRYFTGTGSLNNALAELAAKLSRHGIDYVVTGGMALKAYGYRRLTNNINLVLSEEGLTKFGQELLGRGGFGVVGYDRVVADSIRQLQTYPGKVSIQIEIAGEYPGDGKPKPVVIPDPTMAWIEIDGVRFITLEKLVELKLASGMTARDRLKDLADVQELIKVRPLRKEFARRLDPYVRDKFLELFVTVEEATVEERGTLRVAGSD